MMNITYSFQDKKYLKSILVPTTISPDSIQMTNGKYSLNSPTECATLTFSLGFVEDNEYPGNTPIP